MRWLTNIEDPERLRADLLRAQELANQAEGARSLLAANGAHQIAAFKLAGYLSTMDELRSAHGPDNITLGDPVTPPGGRKDAAAIKADGYVGVYKRG